jgi:hypothetical protein
MRGLLVPIVSADIAFPNIISLVACNGIEHDLFVLTLRAAGIDVRINDMFFAYLVDDLKRISGFHGRTPAIHLKTDLANYIKVMSLFSDLSNNQLNMESIFRRG